MICQILSKSPKFCGRYYKKTCWSLFFWTHCTCMKCKTVSTSVITKSALLNIQFSASGGECPRLILRLILKLSVLRSPVFNPLMNFWCRDQSHVVITAIVIVCVCRQNHTALVKPSHTYTNAVPSIIDVVAQTTACRADVPMSPSSCLCIVIYGRSQTRSCRASIIIHWSLSAVFSCWACVGLRNRACVKTARLLC